MPPQRVLLSQFLPACYPIILQERDPQSLFCFWLERLDLWNLFVLTQLGLSLRWMALLLLQQLLFSHLEVYARSISVSGVVARQNMIYLMGRKRWELFAQFVGKLPIKTLKWWWDASLSMITRSYSASETSNHHLASGPFLLVTWKLVSLLQKGQSGKPGRKHTQKWKLCHPLLIWTSLLLAKLT